MFCRPSQLPNREVGFRSERFHESGSLRSIRGLKQAFCTIALVLAGVLTVFATANGKGALAQRYHVSRWTAEEGLPQNGVTSLAQTPDGYLWVGTWSGLARFDGTRFTLFNESTTPAMVSQTINALAVDQEGNLWIGTEDGLLRFRDRRFSRFTKADGLPDQMVWRFAPSPRGGVWMHCGSYMVHWRDGALTTKVKVLAGPQDDVRSLKAEADGSVTVVTKGTIRRIALSGEVQPVAVPPISGSTSSTWSGAWRQQDRFWVSRAQGLWVSNEDSWKQVLVGTNRSDVAHYMYEDQKGSLWVNRSEGGLWRCVGESAEQVVLDERRVRQSVNCILEDAEGHFWFGTADGLFQLRSTIIRAVTSDNGLPSEACRSVAAAADGTIWVETKGGLARIEEEQAHTFGNKPFKGEPRNMAGNTVLVDNHGTLWFSQGNFGLIVWRPGEEANRFWNRSEGVSIEALYADRAGRVWVGSGRGAIWFEDGRPAADWGEFELPTRAVRSIYQTRDGAMWFGTWRAGVIRWKERGTKGAMSESAALRPTLSPVEKEKSFPEARRYTTADGLADNRVFVFHEDEERTLWIGTHNGLSRLKEGRLFTFRTEHGLLNNLINWFEEDEFGRLWFGCNRGIFRIDRRELNAVADGKKTRANGAVYGTADGMPIAETNGEHQPAGCKAPDGRIWFPTPRGVVVVDPRSAKQNEQHELAPPVVIEQVLADREVIFGDNLKLPPTAHSRSGTKLMLGPGRARVLEIRFTANSFVDPRRIRFRYRMMDRDDSWREVSDERVAYYTDLRPGNFRFEVTAANSHGIWNETPAVFEFSLAPHLYQTWTFYFGCAAAVVISGFGIHFRRLRVLRRLQQLEQQRALEEERARIARDLHDDLGANLSGIALKVSLAQRQLQTSSASANQLAEIATSTRGLVDNMRETVWALNPKHDTLESLARFLATHVEKFVTDAGLRCRLELPDHFPALTVESATRYHVHLAIKEALNNAIKHASAKEVRFGVQIDAKNLCLSVADDGRGFEEAPSQAAEGESRHAGNGIGNMRERVKRLGGELEIKSAPDQGTEITVRIPRASFAARTE